MEADSIDNEPQAKRQKIEEQENVNETETEIASDNLEFMNKVENPDKYTNYVTPEELERLQEYKVLDEVKSNDEDSNDEDSESSDGKEDLPDEEIEKMLEEDLPDGFKRTPKPKEKPYVTRQKIVLQEKGVNHFEVLPLDWMMVRHYSGMPIYMHRTTRVCTLSKPYFLGKGNTRRHDIPISAIPCYSYRRALEEEQKQKEIDQKIQEQIRSGAWALNSSQNNFNNNANQNDNVINGSIVKQETQIIDMENVKIERNDDEYSINGNRIEAIEIEIKGIKVRSDAELLAREIKMDENSQSDTEILPGDIKIDENSQSDPEILSRDIKIDENSQSDADMLATDVKVDENSQSDADMLATDVKVDENSQSDAEMLATDVKVDENSQDDTINTDDLPRCPFNRINTNETSETQSSGEIPLNRQPVVLPGGIVMPPPRVESVNSSWKTQHLTPEQINDYCKRLFKFRTVNIMHFNRWADRRKYTKARKTLQYPTLPEGTKLITIPAQNTGNENGNKTAKRDWVMNMNGRCYLSVFHEYVYRALQKQPVYEFKQLENASTPYQATVYIGGMQYGVGYGSSKRQAKSAAARASIHILIPEMRDQIEPAPAHQDPDFSFFDYVSIEDPRISEFCAATCEPSPHAILRTCLLRNFGAGDRHIHTEMKKLEYQKIELTMKVGKHSATVVCKNKKTAKQRASQSILQALHPHVRSWGSLLRLYGSRSVKSCKEKKLEEQQITLLQDKARQNEPNYAVLEKLRNEMLKLRERDEAVVPIGTLLLPADLPPSASDLNHVQL